MNDENRQAPEMPRVQRGFTLLEMLLVVVILGVMAQLVMPSFARDVPVAETRAEAQKLAAVLGYLRSESRLQSQTYGLEIATPEQGAHRYRILMPREKIIVPEGEEQPADDPSGRPDFFTLLWQELPPDVRFRAIHVGRLERDRPVKAREISFDPRGRTPQKILELVHRKNEEVIYSVIVAPLSGAISVEKGEQPFRTASDGDFF